ncbi:sensor histidine kinase [Spirosoma linguale]|uniref:Signal transduction histidine kinase, LytS n=1 Tax=Spirosoma linguale (strain ATCC 33905 / DSM 74 / LMG 10896 / Claus 1) TaxID=504472 RepID=D2QGT5_SPILD|nr:signal transduction histidine kinase, LytS [Spirosoma linguale DSM 74]
MELTLKEVTQQPNAPTQQQWLTPRRLLLWEKWGIWIVIAIGIIILLYTDFGDFVRGFKDGFEDAGRKDAATLIGAIIGGLFGLLVIIGLLSGIAYVYYVLFHRHVFKKNQTAYTILYIVCLLLLWNFISDGLTSLFANFDLAKKREAKAYNEMFASTLTSLLLIYMVVYGFIVDFRKSRKLQVALIQQRTQAELDALKAQVNPHFLFNSLNNIYGTAILEDSPRTAESIQQLSGIVRYVMEESRLQTTDIQRELRFLDDFVELQRLRLPNKDNIDIRVNIDWDEKPARIVPLLLNPLIENAFKYGISMQYPCFVHVRLRVQDGTLHLTTENSVLTRTDLEKGTGLGLANVRQRLMLAYPDRHTLTVSDNNDTFLVELTIHL